MKLKTIVVPALMSFCLVGSLAPVAGCAGKVTVKIPEIPLPPPPPPAPEPPPPPPPPAPAMKGAQLDIPGEIEFDIGKATMKETENTTAVLKAVHKAMKDLPTVKVRVEGHTDSDGVAANNMALSLQRAGAVISWLTAKGIEPGRLHPIGCGSKTPLVPNTSPENKARNRRTEFDVEELDGKKPEGFTEACAPNPAGK